MEASHRFWPAGVKGVLALAMLLVCFFGYELGNRNFADPDEGRYVEIPREMVLSGDFVTPRLNDLQYLEKPPLFYWLQSLNIKLFGIDEVSMRLWVVFFAILGCLMVFVVGRRRFSDSVGLLSAVLLSTNLLYYSHSRLIILDMVLAVCMSGTLWCFYESFVKPSKHHSKLLICLMYVFAALACLVKGLIGVILPGMVIFLWICFTRNWRKIPDVLYPPAIALFLLIFLPWHILMAYRHEDFLHKYFVVEHFLRYTTTIHCRYQPFWFFVPIVLVGLFPYTGFVLMGLMKAFRQAIKRDSNAIFLLCWVCGIFIFFSFAQSKLIPYIVPILPPLALITAYYMVSASESEFKVSVLITIAFFIVLVVGYYFAYHKINDVLKNPDAVLLVQIFGVLVAASAAVLLVAVFVPRKRCAMLLVFFFMTCNMMWIFNNAAAIYQEIKKPSTKKMADFISLNSSPDDIVCCYRRYYQDFPVYLNRTVQVVDYVGELEYGASIDTHKSMLMNQEELWKLWRTTKKRIFLLSSREHYREIFAQHMSDHRLLDCDEYFVVISNR